jgi:pimeloyl-ACP methyl ester carboxylesterase
MTQSSTAPSESTAVGVPTEFVDAAHERYAYRRLGKSGGRPLLFLQHFTGTLDNWDPALVDRVAVDHDVILFDNAGIGRSSGSVPDTIAGMTAHALAFLDAIGILSCDILGFSLGGMIAQQMVLDRPSIANRLVLVGTAPRGGEDIMHMEKPRLAKYTQDPQYSGYQVLQKIFFPLTDSAQAAGAEFIARLQLRKTDLEPPSGPAVAQAQMASFREWEHFDGERFADLKRITQPTLVMNGVEDDMIVVRNSYWMGETLPNAVLLTYPNAGHGSLFQYNAPFARQVKAFLASDSPIAPY